MNNSKIDMCLLSIIVPIYKIEPYLHRCIDSILSQTFTDWELILVDDGSPDNCPKICDVYAKKDGRIKVIHKKNGGLSSARNAGLDIARGKYISFIDGDDYIGDSLITNVVYYMEQGYDIVSFGQTTVLSNGKMIRNTFVAKQTEYCTGTDVEKLSFLVDTFICCKNGWAVWGRMYNHHIIKKFNLRFVDNKKIFAEDICFNLCYYLHASKVIAVPIFDYYYCMRDDSITHNSSNYYNPSKNHKLMIEFYSHAQCYIDKEVLSLYYPILYLYTFYISLGVLCRNEHISRKEVLRFAKDKFIYDKGSYDSTMMQANKCIHKVPINSLYYKIFLSLLARYFVTNNPIYLFFIISYEIIERVRRRIEMFLQLNI